VFEADCFDLLEGLGVDVVQDNRAARKHLAVADVAEGTQTKVRAASADEDDPLTHCPLPLSMAMAGPRAPRGECSESIYANSSTSCSISQQSVAWASTCRSIGIRL
jgi:hypothetical protein